VYRAVVLHDTLDGLATRYNLNGRQAVNRILRQAKVSVRIQEAVRMMAKAKAEVREIYD
jgi:hypothetical protein